MRFAFTDDQLEFAAALRDLLDVECPADTVRAAWHVEHDLRPLWSRLVEMGVVGALAPEGVGGTGLDEVTLAALLAEAGRAAVPLPLGDVAMVAVPIVRDFALTSSTGDGDAESILEAICSGRARVAVGLSVDTVGGSAVVDGASEAEWFLLQAADGLHLVDRDVVDIEPVGSSDGPRHLGRVRWTPSGATLLPDAVVAAGSAVDRSALAAAAQLCGLADRMIELSVAYAAERRQFGVPIGSFQAVQHRLADALLAVEFAKPLVWRAAISLATGDERSSIDVSMAKSAASDAAETVAAAALQCHGAIGYTVEYDLHLYLQRAWALARRSGTAGWHRARVRQWLVN